MSTIEGPLLKKAKRWDILLADPGDSEEEIVE